MITITLFYRDNSPLCNQVEKLLNELQPEIPHRLVRLNIEKEKAFEDLYTNEVPVIQVGPYCLKAPFTRQELTVVLRSARDRAMHLEQEGDLNFRKKIERGKSFTGTDRFSYWLSNHYMFLFNILVLLYVGIPFLAPVFMKVGMHGSARIIYTIYKPLCHQLGFRSWFLFGEQCYYPREIANIPNLQTYEQIIREEKINILDARRFIGNNVIGYKVAYCQRDVAIYGGILLFGFAFSISGRRLKSLPWYYWLFIGLVPIGLDGLSQLPSLTGWKLVDWLPIRESTPLIRTLTGSLFGITTAWYIYPLIEESMLETRRMLIRKKAVIDQTS